MAIVHARVDERLIHGQVAMVWMGAIWDLCGVGVGCDVGNGGREVYTS